MKHHLKTLDAPSNAKTLVVENLQPGTKYFFAIESYNNLGSSGDSPRTFAVATYSMLN